MKNKTDELIETGVRDEIILANIGEGLIVTDDKGIIVKTNQAFSDMLGFSADEVYEKKIFEVVPNIDKNGNVVAEIDRLVTKTLTEKLKITSTDISYRRKDGTIFPVAITVSPIIFNNEVIGAVEIFRDISKEREYLNDARRFQLAVESASDQIVISDPEGNVIYANKALERITGYKPEEAIGKKAGSLWGNLMDRAFYTNMWNTIKIEKKSFSGQIKNRNKNGEVYDAAITVSPVLDENNKIQFFVSIERNITREKETERIKDEFISSVSHELRTPMSAVKGLVSMILKGDYGEVPERFRQPLTNVGISAERQIHLINDLLNLSRLQTGIMKFTLSNFILRKMVDQIVESVRPKASYKGITLNISTTSDAQIQADDIWVKQILENLISNAVKFTDKGEVTVSCSEKGELVTVLISDTGIGISPPDQEQLFSKFQINKSILQKTAGSGLGLYIAREIARKMGGDVRLEQSELGKGTTFALSLPKSGYMLAETVKIQLEKDNMLSLNSNMGS